MAGRPGRDDTKIARTFQGRDCDDSVLALPFWKDGAKLLSPVTSSLRGFRRTLTSERRLLSVISPESRDDRQETVSLASGPFRYPAHPVQHSLAVVFAEIRWQRLVQRNRLTRR